MDTQVSASLLVLALVVVAGCSGPAATGTATVSPTPTPAAGASPANPSTMPASTPTATPSATPTPTPTETPGGESVNADEKVTVKGGNLSFDAATVYRRVVWMHGLNLSEVPDVTVNVRDRASVPLSRVYVPTPFEKAMGITTEAGETAIAGLARGSSVFIYTEVVTDPAEREAVLAHEYAHVLQGVLGVYGTVGENLGGRNTQRGRVSTGVIEGGSTFVENRYRVKYLGQEPRRLDWNASRSGRTAFGAFIVAPYVFGHKYLFQRIDTVEQLGTVYEDPPQTTEQLIHNYDPEAEPPRSLTVEPATGDTSWSVAAWRTKGELFVRLVLERQLAPGRAATAAAGWGNDRLLSFRDDGDRNGFAWVTRWDDTANASDFAAALTDYLDARGAKSDGVWSVNGTSFRVVRPSDETVVLLAGAESFVRDAAVSGADGAFTVALDGTNTTTVRRVDDGAQMVTTVTAPSNSRITS